MIYMFFGCTKLTSLDLSNLRTDSLEAVNGMFEECTNLKYLDISNFDITNATMMYYFFFFSGCENLEHINSNFP